MSWLAFGDFVIDRLLGCSRADRLSIHFDREKPSRNLVYESLGLEKPLPIDYTIELPRVLYDLDRLAIDASRQITDILTGAVVPPGLPLRARLSTFDLSAEDILRLWRVRSTYPEILFDSLLVDRLEADMAHLRSLRDQFCELALTFMRYDVP